MKNSMYSTAFDKSVEQIHIEKVRKLKKRPEAIVEGMTPEKADIMHMGMGIGTESGEINTTIKRFVIYGKELDRQNLIEELGDLEFYLEGLRQAIDVSREETLEHNNNKLAERYEDYEYTDQRAIDRADKEGCED